jgi:flavin reductase (DIM6/NTAB) family NADH-FMN oxidoreductase RutF
MTAPTVPDDLWKRLTSTVGLVSVRCGAITNVMAAEWSYFVNKAPLYAAVVLGPRAATGALIAEAGEFALTLCSEDQAELADFAGAFSVADVDKTGSELIEFGAPRAIGSPWVAGGLLAAECVVRETVRFPGHTMYAGEVVAAHLPEGSPRPLVKHGAMYGLGEPVRRAAVAATAQLLPGGVLRVAATGPAGDGDARWRIGLVSEDGAVEPLGEHASTAHGDVLVDLPVPSRPALERPAGGRVVVERDGAKPGYARITRPSRSPR